MLHVRLHGLGMDAADVDELVVVAVDEVALEVEHVGEAAGEAGAEVEAGAAEHAHRPSRHVLAAVVSRALDHGHRAGVAHREALAGHPGGVQLAARGAVEAGVAHDDGVLRHEARAARVAQHDAAGRHPLADVVVGIAFEIQVEPAGVPHPEALPGAAAAAHGERGPLHAVVAPAPSDLPRDARADRAVEVAEVVVPFAAALALDRRQHVAHHALGELAAVEGWVRVGRAELRRIGGQAARGEDGREVELALPGRLAAHHLEMLGAADDLGERAHTEGGEDLTHLLGHETEVVDHHLGEPGEVLRAQHVVLGGDPGGAVVEMADAQILAPERHHRRAAETEALRAEDRRLHDVEAGLEAPVGLQPHPVAQIVAAQRLVGLGEAELPRRARVLDGGQGARARAAVIARDRDQVGVGLGDSGGDRAHPGLGDQLHRHQRLRIDLLQVEDELRQVLDRVDVVVRRRGDQADARPRKAQAGDHVVDLVPRELAALARLRSLGDLDLQHLGVDQVFRGHAEASGRHLLDLRVALGAVAARILAPFARIRARPEPVHGDGECLMRLGGERA